MREIKKTPLKNVFFQEKYERIKRNMSQEQLSLREVIKNG